MTTSLEDVLLGISHVRYKKGDGTLYLMNQRLVWMVEHRDIVVVSHKYADIKTQKISPAGKAKIQLQVVLHDGGCSTFHFVNPAGAEAQADDRDKVKTQLQNLLPQFRRQVNRELEEKSRLLSLHPTLKHLYEDLVITKVLSSEEYWNTTTIKQYTESQSEKQEIGVSGAFLADIKPQTDGCNGLKYNLTQDIIEAVFKTYPAVRRKHVDYVPNKMTEAEFWTKFFQSHYFHRDRIASSSKDLFTECGRLDDLQLGKAMALPLEDPLLDMARWSESDPLEDLAPPPNPASSKITSEPASVHKSMIKRFNQHSIMVLKAGENIVSTAESTENNVDKKPETNGVIVPDKDDLDLLGPPSKKKRIHDKICFEDLQGDDKSKAVPQLELSKVERYLHGPTALENLDQGQNKGSANQRSAARFARSSLLSWTTGNGGTRPLQPSPPAAVSALGELSPGGALMRHHHTHSLAQLVPPDVESEVRRLYLGGGELLRSFWRCFPPGSTASPDAEKVSHAHEAVQRFRIARVKPFEDRMVRELSPLAHSLTKHLSQLLQAATAKFTIWQSRQAKIRIMASSSKTISNY